MIFKQRELPKLRLLINMEVLTQENNIYRNIITSVTCRKLGFTIVGYKFTNQRIGLLNFENKCLLGIHYYTLLNQSSREISLLKFLQKSAQHNDIGLFYMFVGFSDGHSQLYQFAKQKIIRIQEFNYKQKQIVLDVYNNKGLLTIIRKRSVTLYEFIGSRFVKKQTESFESICSSHCKTKLYLSTGYNLLVCDKRTLKTETIMKSYSFYYIKESIYSQNYLYLGGTDDIFTLKDLRTSKVHTFSGFKNYISSIVEQYHLLWIVGLDGRMACMNIQGIQTERLSTERGKSEINIYADQVSTGLKHIEKVHNTGIWSMITQDDFLIIYDCEGCIVIYEVIFPNFTEREIKN